VDDMLDSPFLLKSANNQNIFLPCLAKNLFKQDQVRLNAFKKFAVGNITSSAAAGKACRSRDSRDLIQDQL
jgi:hypothetical protein